MTSTYSGPWLQRSREVIAAKACMVSHHPHGQPEMDAPSIAEYAKTIFDTLQAIVLINCSCGTNFIKHADSSIQDEDFWEHETHHNGQQGN
jgi:hypothetical protein